jgi:CubicO group peptidase (beta-lactamase class C family)
LVRPASIVPLVLLSIAVCEQRASAQSLSFALFERYLEAVRIEAGIPGMSAVIVQDGNIAWEAYLGRQDVEGAVATSPRTPYPIGQLSQTFGATLLLRKCMDQSTAELTDRVTRWVPTYPEPATTLGELLSHVSPIGGYQYAPDRFARLTNVIEECGHAKYSQLLADEVFDRTAMFDSAPDQTLLATAADTSLFGAGRLDRYREVLRRVAVPYRVVNRRAQRNTDFPAQGLDASVGIVSTARDLANFDIALDSSVLLEPATRNLAWTQAFAGPVPLPTGLGWFVQGYNGQPIVWQFGSLDGAYSSLVVKVPNRHLTFILLANSDGLSAPFALSAGDVTSSLFARLFLKSFVP